MRSMGRKTLGLTGEFSLRFDRLWL
jgi:hypothetical protein